MESQAEIIIQCTSTSPRLAYMAAYLQSALGVGMRIEVKPFADGEFKTKSDHERTCLINYGDTPIDGAFNIYATGLLHETTIRPINPTVIKQPGQTLLFPAPPGFDLPFDMFSAAFYLLSRYEEYLTYKPDRHGRFEADQSLAFRHNFLDDPVVDQWLEMLKNKLMVNYPALHFPRRPFRYVSTIDTDSAWAYLHKGTVRTAGGLAKNIIRLNTIALRMQLDVLRGKRPDPFDTYAYIREMENRYGFRSLFFFLYGNYGCYDNNYSLHNVHFRSLLERLKQERVIGIHPSYKSNSHEHLLKAEADSFTRLLGKKPEISRQHFLILKLPYTYRQLIKLGIQEDYSMGYASDCGFRAGTSMPFRFYDLADECETPLLIHPFAVMDVTLRQYLGLDTAAASHRINHLIEKTRAVHGTFTSLWHNESLSEEGIWRGWRRVFEGMAGEVGGQLF